MKRQVECWWLGLAAGLVTACVGDARQDEADDAAEVELEARDGDVLDEACPDSRIVGRRHADAVTCPDPNDPLWQVTNVLEAGTEYLAENPPALAAALRRYCSYEWIGDGPPPPQQVAAIEAQLEEPSRDCQAVFPTTDVGLEDLLNPVLTDIWADRIGIVHDTELDIGIASQRLTVMVIDTMPFQPPPGGPRMRHGETMARAIEDIACPDGPDCTVTVNRILGLPRIENAERDPIHGGFAGTYSDLAAATIEAITRWQSTPNAGRLMLSYSLGWDTEVFDEPGATQLANLDMIRDALDYARCRGAVIVASAGNATSGLCSSGPTAPGLWETAASPSVSRCKSLGVTIAAAPTGPLLYAAGGVALDGGDFGSSRPEGVPRMVALADHVVVPSAPDEVVSGTSIAAAEVTGAIALAARFAPDLSPSQLADSVHRGGTLTGDTADFGRGVLQPVRALDVCGGLLEVCDRSAVCTAFAKPCTRGSTGVPTLADLVVDEPADASPVVKLSARQSCAATCGETTFASHVGSVGDACEDTKIDPLIYFIDPQPGRDGCPHCILADNKLLATLGKEVESNEVQELAIDVTDGNGSITRVSLGDVQLEHETITEIAIDPALFPAEVKYAEVIVVTPTAPLRNDLLVQ